MDTKNLKGFNVRVYAVCIENNKLFCIKENFLGIEMIKMPGGGLEFGEGTVECLKREFKEELNLNIEVKDCFYIQEDFVPSLVNDQKQILILYFKIDLIHSDQMKIQEKEIKEVLWIDLDQEDPFSLPVDRIVFEKIKRINNE